MQDDCWARVLMGAEVYLYKGRCCAGFHMSSSLSSFDFFCLLYKYLYLYPYLNLSLRNSSSGIAGSIRYCRVQSTSARSPQQKKVVTTTSQGECRTKSPLAYPATLDMRIFFSWNDRTEFYCSEVFSTLASTSPTLALDVTFHSCNRGPEKNGLSIFPCFILV